MAVIRGSILARFDMVLFRFQEPADVPAQFREFDDVNIVRNVQKIMMDTKYDGARQRLVS